MKKTVALILSVIVICFCSTTVSAEKATYSTAGDLYEAWHDNLPDYICGVWSTNGGSSHITFGIQNNESGNAGKQEMLELVENDSTLTFVYQVFSRNYLLQIQKEIDEYLGEDLGLVSTAVDDINNCIVLGILEERKDDLDTQNMIEDIIRKYASAVNIEYTDEILFTIGETDTFHTQLILQVTIVITSFFLIGIGILVAKRRKMSVLRTTIGTTVAASTSLSVKEVEDLVRASHYRVPSDLDQKVMNIINDHQ